MFQCKSCPHCNSCLLKVGLHARGLLWHAVCGRRDIITIRDYGDGTCDARVDTLGGDTLVKPCDQSLFNRTCGSLSANVVLVVQNNATGVYSGPHFDRWLSLMGLNEITSLEGDLLLRLDHNAGTNPIPPPVSPQFFPRLRIVTGTLEASEFGAQGSLRSVPGFLSFLYAQREIAFTNTGLRDFSGTFLPICPPAVRMFFTGNSNLFSFAGFERMQTAVPFTGIAQTQTALPVQQTALPVAISNTSMPLTLNPPQIRAENNIQLTDLDALYTVVGCPTPSPSGFAFFASAPCDYSNPLQTYADVCNYIATGLCPCMFC